MPKRKHLRLYLLVQDTVTGYDTFDSCVVAAESPEAARQIHPRNSPELNSSDPCVWKLYKEPDWNDRPRWQWVTGNLNEKYRSTSANSTWCAPEKVTVKQIGLADADQVEGVICASFNAG